MTHSYLRPERFCRFVSTPPEFLRETFLQHEQQFGRRDLEREVRRMLNTLEVDT